MARLAYVVSMLAAAAVTLSAQNLAETALAAATGSVAGVAAKPISDSLTKVFGQVNAQAKSSTNASEQKKETATPEVVPTKSEVSTPAPGFAPASPGSGPATGRKWSGFGRMQYAARPPAPATQSKATMAASERPQPTMEQIASVSAGMERSDVLTRLGTPVARLSIPDSGQFLEVYQYVDRGGNTGSVRLRDGRVSEVRVDNQAN